jgi:hypothetical protein
MWAASEPRWPVLRYWIASPGSPLALLFGHYVGWDIGGHVLDPRAFLARWIKAALCDALPTHRQAVRCRCSTLPEPNCRASPLPLHH